MTDKVAIANPLNNLVIDKNGPIKNIQLPYNSNILSDLNPKLIYNTYIPKNDITLSDMTRLPNTGVKGKYGSIVDLRVGAKKKSATPNGSKTPNNSQQPIEIKVEPTNSPVINSPIEFDKTRLNSIKKSLNPQKQNRITKIKDNVFLAKTRKRNLGLGGR